MKMIQKRKFSPEEDFHTEGTAIESLREMQRISLLNGNSNMTLEEINAEIYAARRESESREVRGVR